MQYSAVVIALFAATALAAPAETLQSTDATLADAGDVINIDPEYTSETDETYVPVVEDNYSADNTTTDTGYETSGDNADGEYEIPTEYYEPKPQSCYTKEQKPEYGDDYYFAKDDAEYQSYEKNSIIDEYHYPEQIDAGHPCPITYKPKDSSYKGTYKVALCSSTDGYKTCHDVCHDEASCGSYKPDYSTIPSDSNVDGCMYTFKTYHENDVEKCTYSAPFPIYNPQYYVSNKNCKPEPTKCPPPKYVIPAPKPDQTPVAPVKPVEKPVEKPTEKPTYPVAPVPVAPTNETSPVDVQPYTAGSSAVRTSVSAIVGIAAIVAFAL